MVAGMNTTDDGHGKDTRMSRQQFATMWWRKYQGKESQWRIVKVEIQCQNDFTSCYSVQQMRNNAEIYIYEIFTFKVDKITRFR